ncbi:MAG: SNF2 helicase associated domain-containing protein [Clostridiales bacterium]|nr:SNF2 helicase associated domain-containing protein [Clostridiales bacterium]
MGRLQKNWKEKFITSTLERGETAFQNHKVVDLKQDGDRYSAAVLDRARNEVSLTLQNGAPTRMNCHCPVARSGNCCVHMAALLIAIEAMDHPKQISSENGGKDPSKRDDTRRTGRTVKEEVKRETKKEIERAAKEEAQRAERRAAREKRKAERAEKEAQQKAAAEALRQRQLEKQKAEEARREAIRQEKKVEEERRRQKHIRDEEAARADADKRKKQEERACRTETYSLLGDTWRDDEDEAIVHGSIESLNRYSYFDAESIFQSADLSDDLREAGIELYDQGVVDGVSVETGYERNSRSLYENDTDMIGVASWQGKEGRSEFQTTVYFTRDSVRRVQCTCPKCMKSYNWYYESKATCAYAAAVLTALKDCLASNPVGDATDWNAKRLLSLYDKKRTNLFIADRTAETESLTLKPRLVKKGGALSVSFKIGIGKLFVIKQLDEFCENVRNAETAAYGSNTSFNHRRSNFTDSGQKWIRFIERIVQEEEEFCQRMAEAVRSRYYYHRSVKVGGSLDMFGWRLDELYKELADESVEYEDRDAVGKVKKVLRCGEGNPHVTFQIEEANLSSKRKGKKSGKATPHSAPSDGEFHGIQVSGTLPELFFGMDCAYYVSDNLLCRSSQGFQEKIENFAEMVDESGRFTFRVGRKNLSEFYYHLLPELQDIADVVETDPERIHAFLAPPVKFVFYLDAGNGDVQCHPFARYDQTELSLMDHMNPAFQGTLETYRNVQAEQEMLYRLYTWFPVIDMENEELSCDGDEELIYQIMTSGVEELLALGEVQCTDRFRARRKVRPVKISVGVSVSGGLLDLDIVTDDVPPEELLDILNAYREKKTYYRLKDGSYVDMDRQSLDLLLELMESMHIKPGDFVQGKMHLPLYRTLYLNKMLEENEGVYNDRDRHFREMVKEFKTVNDADFDVPSSLSGIMRRYQKDGYKWLRTLETWKLGGILADDMGLGKTLQIIALLLSAKERSVTEAPTSLVVAPASLVFNWGEEFARFAPEMKILLITGTQKERQEKIAACREYDVAVTSYDLLKRDINLYEEITFEYEVIDEAQYIKNHTTAAAKAVKVIKSRYHFALTGTPIENRLSELWSIFDFLMPGFLYTYEVFRREMETPIVKYQDEQAMQRLQKMTGPFILRRLKENVLKDLPDKLEEVRYVQFDAKQQQLYDGQVLHMRRLIASQDAAEFNRNKLAVLTELMRLRQICCDPSLCFESYQGESAKADACMDLIQIAIDGGHRMLLFSQFTSMLDILQGRLDNANIPYYTITGSTSKQKRLELVKDFNAGNVPVFLISLKAGGIGLNLIGADVVIHYDPWWNVAAQNQATDRAHRIGQTKKVTVFKLIVRNSIEEKILALQETKRDLADQVIGGDAGQLAGMSRDDLLELLGET